MVKVNIRSNMVRKEFTFTHDTTIRQAIDAVKDEVRIDYTVGLLNIDGMPIVGADIDKTFAELGYDGTARHNCCNLTSVVKADNA